MQFLYIEGASYNVLVLVLVLILILIPAQHNLFQGGPAVLRKSSKTAPDNLDNTFHVFFGILDVTWQA